MDIYHLWKHVLFYFIHIHPSIHVYQSPFPPPPNIFLLVLAFSPQPVDGLLQNFNQVILTIYMCFPDPKHVSKQPP